jgi:hypothetical protein
MSITNIGENEQRLAQALTEANRIIERLVNERDDAIYAGLLIAKRCNLLVQERDALETHNTMLRVCLKNVIKVADRNTDEFDAAREALGVSL